MIIPSMKIETLTSKNDLRQYFNHVYFDRGRQVLAACLDGYASAIVPCRSEPEDSSGYLSAEAIAAARKLAGKNGEPQIAMATDGSGTPVQVLSNGARFPQPDTHSASQFPIATMEKIWRKGNYPHAADITLDADLLYRLAGAITATAKNKRISLRFARKDDGSIDPVGAISVRAQSGDDTTIALLMPCHE